jgi:hypothetical protein
VGDGLVHVFNNGVFDELDVVFHGTNLIEYWGWWGDFSVRDAAFSAKLLQFWYFQNPWGQKRTKYRPKQPV